MRKFATVFLSVVGICGPFAANADLPHNNPVSQDTLSVISVSGAHENGLTYQVAHLNGEVSTLQQQMQSILLQQTMAQVPAQLYPNSIGG